MPIEQIKVGDKVLSYDEKTKQFEYKAVAQTFITVKENIVKIKIRGERLLTTTTEHPFYVKKTHKARDGLNSESDDEEGEWLTASELKVGQRVLRPDGKWTRITSIEQSSEPTLVYNLEVEGNHNYFVGEIGVLSHNCAFNKSWASMSAAEQNAFKHAMSRHGEELGLPNFRETNADALMKQFNSIIDHIRTNGTMIGVERVPFGDRGSGIATQRVDAYVYNFTDQAGKAYYLWIKKDDGRFISAGLIK